MNKMKILVVDDDPNILQLITLYLTKEGFDVVQAQQGDEALRSFKSAPPNLVLLDIMLPVMDGWQVCREIRKVSNIPIIMLTAKDETFDKVLGLELGADDYIVKPFDTKELEVLYFLAAHQNRVFTREQLLEQVWGFDFFGDSRTVDVHIKRLREKLPGCENLGWSIRTVWSVGYKFEVK